MSAALQAADATPRLCLGEALHRAGNAVAAVAREAGTLGLSDLDLAELVETRAAEAAEESLRRIIPAGPLLGVVARALGGEAARLMRVAL